MKFKIAILGLGYVGLPVAVEFGKNSKVIGFDTKNQRIEELGSLYDRNNEVTKEELSKSEILFTSNPEDLKKANFYIITVPTPISKNNTPDLSALKSATTTVSKFINKGDIIVYESTVYPGVTEDICVPILEKVSGLKLNKEFKVGYSPERINPGDKEHTFTKIIKVVSGSDQEALEKISTTYETVVKAGVYEASSIKVAEAAKVIENTQRDINIAFMNELSLIFDKLDINTRDVLDAASTKWNFLNFHPGLVGGHCIGVDPYYLTYRAQEVNYMPEVILAGRRINDSMPKELTTKLIKKLILNKHTISNLRVTILGLTFKENTPDIRNSKVYDIYKELKEYGLDIQVHDPIAHADEAEEAYNINLTDYDDLQKSDVLILAVNHSHFSKMDVSSLSQLINGEDSVILNISSQFKNTQIVEIAPSSWSI